MEENDTDWRILILSFLGFDAAIAIVCLAIYFAIG